MRFNCLSNFILFQHLSLRVCCHEAIFSKKQLQRFFPAQVIFRKTSLVEAAVIFENKEKTTMCSFWAAIKIRKLSCVRWRQQQQLAKSLFRTDKRTLWKDYSDEAFLNIGLRPIFLKWRTRTITNHFNLPKKQWLKAQQAQIGTWYQFNFNAVGERQWPTRWGSIPRTFMNLIFDENST